MASRPQLQHKPSEHRSSTANTAPAMVRADAAHMHMVALLLGRSLSRSKGALGAHELIKRGLPASSLKSLLAHFPRLQRAALFRALGISERTMQRKGALKPLSPEQSGRAWKVAEFLPRQRRSSAPANGQSNGSTSPPPPWMASAPWICLRRFPGPRQSRNTSVGWNMASIREATCAAGGMAAAPDKIRLGYRRRLIPERRPLEQRRCAGSLLLA